MSNLMSWKVREYYDNEAREKLCAAVSDEQLRAMLERVYDDAQNAVIRQEGEMQEAMGRLPNSLESLSNLSGVSQELLVQVIGRISATSRNMSFVDVLDIVGTFFRVKAAMEKK